MTKIFAFLCSVLSVCVTYGQQQPPPANGNLYISHNGHYLVQSNGEPFFWMGDTGWLLFSALMQKDITKYFKDRHAKGFNVVQVMMVHDMPAVNAYGDSAFVRNNMADPYVVSGNDVRKPAEYDYWDHIDFAVDEAAKYGIFLAIVPAWGSIIKKGTLNKENAAAYIQWVVRRFRDKPNIIWVNGGDIRGDANTEVFDIIGNTLKVNDTAHLITFHPFGRTRSSEWFHNRSWLDFNMVQSGHKDYQQDSIGADNWKLILPDFAKLPPKPVLDAEPSYEGIPHGLHDTTQPYWNGNDARRYAYWAVFSGACGHTYGNNAVMQFYSPTSKTKAYGAKKYWEDALNDEGAWQMLFLKKLMMNHDFVSGEPAQDILYANFGKQYERHVATMGSNYAMVYTYTGSDVSVNMDKLPWPMSYVYWYNPRSGKRKKLGTMESDGILVFNPPDEPADGNDWVLLLEATYGK